MDSVSSPSSAPSSTPSTGSSPAGGSPQQSHSPQTTQSSTGNVSSTPSSAKGFGAKSQTPPSSPAPQTGAPATQELFEVKINNKIQRMTRQEVIDHAQMSAAANQRFEEASRMRRDMERQQEMAKKDFMQLLQDPSLGLSKDQIRARFEQWYHQEFIEPESLNPDQRKARQLEAELNQLRQADEQRRQQAEEAQQTQLTNQQREYLQQEIIDAFESSGLPRNKFLMARMAFYMRQNLMNGWDAPKEMLVKQVKQERQSMMSDMVSGATVEQLTELFGNEVMNKIRKYDLEQLRQKRHVDPFQNTAENPMQRREPETKVYTSDVNRRLRDMRTGKLPF